MDLRPMNFCLMDLPMTDKHIVVPLGFELELRMMAAMRTKVRYKDTLFGRDVIWVETLGL